MTDHPNVANRDRAPSTPQESWILRHSASRAPPHHFRTVWVKHALDTSIIPPNTVKSRTGGSDYLQGRSVVKIKLVNPHQNTHFDGRRGASRPGHSQIDQAGQVISFRGEYKHPACVNGAADAGDVLVLQHP